MKIVTFVTPNELGEYLVTNPENYSCRRVRLQGLDFRSMTIRTLRERLLVNDYGLGIDEACLYVTLVTGHSRMATRQREVCSGVVVKRGRHPTLGSVAIGAWRLARFGKLPGMGLFVAILTNL